METWEQLAAREAHGLLFGETEQPCPCLEVLQGKT